MKKALIFRKIRRRKSITNNHICFTIKHELTHHPSIFSWICIIPIYHKITIGINITKHSANDVTLTLTILMTYNRPPMLSNFCCIIG